MVVAAVAKVIWGPLGKMQVSCRGVQGVTNLIGLNDAVEFIDFVAKSASLLYSIASAILLKVKELPKP